MAGSQWQRACLWGLLFGLVVLCIPVVVQGYVPTNDYDYRQEARLRERNSHRRGRKLCIEQNPHEMLVYWQSQVADWTHAEYQAVMREFEQRFKHINAAPSPETPEGMEQFLSMYYFLRNMTKVTPCPAWELPRSKCHPDCTIRGTCNEEVGRCDCPRGMGGAACERFIPEATCDKLCIKENCATLMKGLCVNACHGRGTCVSGFCHCFPGYFGIDCALSLGVMGGSVQILAGKGYKPHPRGPKVYVYELSPMDTVWGLWWVDRNINLVLLERLVTAGLRVADPAQADYFYMPMQSRGCTHWDLALEYINATWGDWMHRKGGKDHIVTLLGDWGRAEQRWVDSWTPFMSRVISLQHWGHTADRSDEYGSKWFAPAFFRDQDILIPAYHSDQLMMFDQGPFSPHSTLMAYYRERLRQMHGGNLPSYLTANISRLSAAARAANLTLQDGPAAAAPKSLAMKRASPPSHSLGRLLMSLRATLSSITASSASTTSSSAASAGAAPAGATSSVELLPNSGMVLGRRPNLAMMAGGICGWRDQRGPPCSRKSYSFGMREQLYTNYHGAPGMEIELRVRDQGASMMNATFCFAPTGAGYGKRQVMVAVMGCIPVLISDHVVEPFEPFIDWPSISVRIKEADVTRAAEILMAVPEGRVRAMQSRLRCAARHMLYSSAYGAALWEDDGRFDAINTIVEILRMRLKHTGAKDADLTKLDKAFADFMSCTETPANQPLQPVPPHLVYPATAHVTNSPTLCYWQRPRNELHLPRNTTQHWCPQYMWRPGAMPIGGAAMCPRDVTQLEKCVRYA